MTILSTVFELEKDSVSLEKFEEIMVVSFHDDNIKLPGTVLATAYNADAQRVITRVETVAGPLPAYGRKILPDREKKMNPKKFIDFPPVSCRSKKYRHESGIPNFLT